MVRDKLIKKYNLYYRYWIDYSVLAAVFATISLLIACFEWEYVYPERFNLTTLDYSNVFSVILILAVSALGVISIIIKYRMEATWRHFNNPMRFYRRILRK